MGMNMNIGIMDIMGMNIEYEASTALSISGFEKCTYVCAILLEPAHLSFKLLLSHCVSESSCLRMS